MKKLYLILVLCAVAYAQLKVIPNIARRPGFTTTTKASAGGSGTVTSVSFTGGLISVATATSTPALTVAGTSGGIPYFSASNTWGSSAALTLNLPVIGGGAGNPPSVGTRSGNTTAFVTLSGSPTSGRCGQFDATGNIAVTAAACGTVTDVIWYGAASKNTLVGAGVFPNSHGYDTGSGASTWAAQTKGMGTVDLTAAATPAVYFEHLLPTTWTGTISVRIPSTLQIAATGTGTYILHVKTSCVVFGTTDFRDVTALSYNTAQDISVTIAGTGARSGSVDTISTLTTTGCSTGNLLVLQVGRTGGSGGDDAADAVGILGAELTVSHT